MKLGSVIKELRIKSGYKQFELAEMCNISATYLSQIESNSKEPNMSTIKDICSKLNLPLPILFYLALDENDISSSKREAFKMIDQPVKSLIKEFFSIK
jgi:XRE family transcriptional regulator, regulator of sulfur utilization